MSEARNLLFRIGGVLVSVLFLGLTLRRVDLSLLVPILAGVSLFWVAVSIVLRLGAFSALTARSMLLFAPQHRFGAWRLLRSILLGFVGNNVLPLRVGEVMRIGYLSRHGRLAPESVLATVALERLLDLFCLALLFLGVLPAATAGLDPGVTFYLLAAGLSAALAATIGISLRPHLFLRWLAALMRPIKAPASGFILRRAERFALGLAVLRSPWRVGGALLTSMVYWAFGLIGVRCWLLAFDLDLPWYAPVVVTSFLAFGTLLPSAPSFAGTYHYFASSALVVLGVDETTAVSFGILGHAVAFLPWTLLALPIVFGDLVWGLKQLGRPRQDVPEEAA